MIKTLLLILNAAKLGPFIKTGGTMLISVVAYAFVFGPWYAVGVVALLFAHEMGHFVSARRLGLDVGAPTFIPFVGAWIELKDAPLSVAQEARIAFAGPFVGTAAALAVLFAGLASDSRLLLAVAYSGLVLNPSGDPRWRPHRRHPLAQDLAARRADPGRHLPLDPEPDVPAGPRLARAHRLAGDQGRVARRSAGGQSAVLRGLARGPAAVRGELSAAARVPMHHDLPGPQDAAGRGGVCHR